MTFLTPLRRRFLTAQDVLKLKGETAYAVRRQGRGARTWKGYSRRADRKPRRRGVPPLATADGARQFTGQFSGVERRQKVTA